MPLPEDLKTLEEIRVEMLENHLAGKSSVKGSATFGGGQVSCEIAKWYTTTFMYEYQITIKFPSTVKFVLLLNMQGEMISSELSMPYKKGSITEGIESPRGLSEVLETFTPQTPRP